jgi:hypothetical protein
MADELVLHYQGQDRLLGSPARLDRAISIVAAVLVCAIAARLLIGARAVGDLAVFAAGMSALVLVVLSYARLRFANAGLFLADGRLGVIGALGGRNGVDATQVDHLQLCTLTPATGRSYGLLLFIDRSDRAILRLSAADLIPAEGLEQLSRRSGFRLLGSWQETYAPADLARRFPGSVALATQAGNNVVAHPWRTCLITVAITAFLLLGLLIALLVRSGR